MDRIDAEHILKKLLKNIDPDTERIFEDDDIQNYIVLYACSQETIEQAQRSTSSLIKKISQDFLFAFEHAATRSMGLSLFTISDDLRKEQSLMSDSVAEGNTEEVESISKRITSLESRYSSTIKQINNLAKDLRQTQTALTLYEREREYYNFRMGGKKASDLKDIKEEREVIAEKMKENPKVGLGREHGLQDILRSPEHEDSDIVPSGRMKDAGRENFANKIKKYRQERKSENQE